jgi:ABC-type multidrug transport system ATPase subunit
LGLNGAGKTTLFSLATRLYAQSNGTIRIFEMDIRERASGYDPAKGLMARRTAD